MDYEDYSIENLPSSQPNEKTFLWSHSNQYTIDSGYSTQAPSVLNFDGCVTNEQLPLETSDSSNSTDNVLAVLPELIKFLNDDDQEVAFQASLIIHDISREETTCMAFIDSEKGVESLTNCLSNQTNAHTIKNIALTYFNISKYERGIIKIIDSNALQALINLLTIPIENIDSISITVLHNVLSYRNDAKLPLRQYGAIEKMAYLLKSNANVKFLAILIDCLQILSYGHQESKTLLLGLDAPESLINILNTTTYAKLIVQTIRLLKVLSVCPQNKKVLIKLGVIDALTKHLTGDNNQIKNCLMTLRNLSDAATKMTGLESLIENLIRLSSTEDEMVVTLATGTLSNLTCNNQFNKLSLINQNGISIILSVIKKYINKADVIEPCIWILRHLNIGHQEVFRVQEQIALNNGIELVISIFDYHSNKWPLMKSVIAFIRNFSLHGGKVFLSKNQLLVEKLVYLMYNAYNQLQQAQYIEDVNLIDIIEMILNIFHQISKDIHTLMYLRNMNCIEFFIKLYYMQVDCIKKLSALLLIEFSQYSEFLQIINNYNVLPELRNSS